MQFTNSLHVVTESALRKAVAVSGFVILWCVLLLEVFFYILVKVGIEVLRTCLFSGMADFV